VYFDNTSPRNDGFNGVLTDWIVLLIASFFFFCFFTYSKKGKDGQSIVSTLPMRYHGSTYSLKIV
jgi:hypothetical protein